MLCEHVAGAGGAVVVEIVVAVDGRLGIPRQCLEDAPLLLAPQVQGLLGHAAAVVAVFLIELAKRGHAHAVVGEAEHEAGDEMGLLEVEHTVVHHQVLTAGGVAHADGGMAIEAINILVGRAGEQADLGVVEAGVGQTVGLGLCRTGQDESGNGEEGRHKAQ